MHNPESFNQEWRQPPVSRLNRPDIAFHWPYQVMKNGATYYAKTREDISHLAVCIGEFIPDGTRIEDSYIGTNPHASGYGKECETVHMDDSTSSVGGLPCIARPVANP